MNLLINISDIQLRDRIRPFNSLGAHLKNMTLTNFFFVKSRQHGWKPLSIGTNPAGKISWINVALTSVSDVRFTLVFS